MTVGNWQLLGGDCRAVLTTLEAESVDACVCDPPYELGFMGKAWDASGVAFDVETWRAVWRVLKPGAHLLAFGGTRTVHRIAVAIEDAGFDIRDQLSWLYGSGFPKSLDVSKAIDAAAGAAREATGTSLRQRGQNGKFHVAVRCNACGLTRNGTSCKCPPDNGPATDAAKQWAGWGTALKPACEPIVLARKPLIGTVAANVLTHGTGGINVDGCRIGLDGAERHTTAARSGLGANGIYGASSLEFVPTNDELPRYNLTGRWPANVLLDEEAAAMLDEQSGASRAAKPSASGNRGTGRGGYNGFNHQAQACQQYSDSGASRFFYVAKAARAERDAGLDHLPPRTGGEATDRKDGSDGLNSPRAGAGRRGGARNFHPTVKPIELMSYLVRLITPPGGLVLDPFAGSGTTGIAALRQGFRFVGVDLEPDYARIAIGRIEEDAPLFNRKRGA